MIRLINEQWERIRNHFPEEHIPDGRPGRKPIPTRCVFKLYCGYSTPARSGTLGQEVATPDQKQLVESLRSGGYVIVVRHGATFSDRADTEPFNFDNIAKQRNLNEKGKELAKAFGDAIRRVGIAAGEVYTSNFNRAFETAVLAGFKRPHLFVVRSSHEDLLTSNQVSRWRSR
jgi:hypothetical protein